MTDDYAFMWLKIFVGCRSDYLRIAYMGNFVVFLSTHNSILPYSKPKELVMLRLFYLVLGSTLLSATQAVRLCPLLGPDFPPPQNLSASLSIQLADANFTQQLHQLLSNQ